MSEKPGLPPLPVTAQIGIEPSDPRDRFPMPVTWPRQRASVTGCLLANEFVWCRVHWNGENTDLCTGSECAICHGDESKALEKGYCPLMEPSRRKLSCLVLPSGCKRALDDLAAKWGGLYGLKLRFERTGSEVNSAVSVLFLEDWRAKVLPAPPNLRYWLPVLFRYAPPPGEPKELPPIRQAAEQRAAVLKIAGQVGRLGEGDTQVKGGGA